MLFTCGWDWTCLTFSGWHVSPLYTLPQRHGMEYTQFFVMLYSVGSLTQKRYFRSVVPLLNIVLIYGQRIFWIFSARPLTYGWQTMVSFRVLFPVVRSRFLRVVVIFSRKWLRWRLSLKRFMICLAITTNVLWLDVVGNEQFFSLHYMDGRN